MPGALAVGSPNFRTLPEPAREPADQAEVANAAARGLQATKRPHGFQRRCRISPAHVFCWGVTPRSCTSSSSPAKPGFAQLLGTCLAIWDDLRPAVTDRQRDAAAAAIAGPRPRPWRAGSFSLIWAATGTEQAAVAALSDAAGPI